MLGIKGGGGYHKFGFVEMKVISINTLLGVVCSFPTPKSNQDYDDERHHPLGFCTILNERAILFDNKGIVTRDFVENEITYPCGLLIASQL
jgi:hypothetical protein